MFFTDPLKLEEYRFSGPRLPHLKLRSSLLRRTLSNLRVLWNLDTIKAKKGKQIAGCLCPMFFFKEKPLNVAQLWAGVNGIVGDA